MPNSRARGASKEKYDMKFIASVSRSGGLEKGGNALTEYHTQEKYKKYIDEQLVKYNTLHSIWEPARPSSQVTEEVRHSLLILYRKLREGILSSKRIDAFATQVYEESAMLCIVFGETSQASPLLAQLVSNFYSQHAASGTTKTESAGKVDSKPRHQDTIMALYLLDLLLSDFSRQWSLIPVLKDSALKDGADEALLQYFKTLSLHIRRLEYVQVYELLQPSRLPCSLPDGPSAIGRHISSVPLFASLHGLALSRSISNLREKLREHSWTILRRSYRDFSLLASSAPNRNTEDTKGQLSHSTGEWLSRRLFLGEGDGKVQDWLAARPSNEVACESVSTEVLKWKLVHAVK